MEKQIHLQIYTTNGEICNEQVNYVELPIAGGPYGILANHAPMLGCLTEGVGFYADGDDKNYFAISGGTVKVENNEVIVLARTAEMAETIDIARAQSSEKRARDRIKEHETHINHFRAETSLHRALARQKAYDLANKNK